MPSPDLQTLLQMVHEVDELEESRSVEAATSDTSSTPRRLMVLAAALVTLFLLWKIRPDVPTGPLFEELAVATTSTRGADRDFHVDLQVRQSAHLAVLAIDEATEPWILPLDAEGNLLQSVQPGAVRFGAWAIVPDPARPPRHLVVVVASPSPLTAEAIVDSVQDPLVPSRNLDLLPAVLGDLARELSTARGWTLSWQFIDPGR